MSSEWLLIEEIYSGFLQVCRKRIMSRPSYAESAFRRFKTLCIGERPLRQFENYLTMHACQ